MAADAGRLVRTALGAITILALGGIALGSSPRAAQAQRASQERVTQERVAQERVTQERVTQERVTLRIRPPVGDTLRMAMQQQFDIEPEDSAGVPQGVMTGALLIWTRAVVLGRKGTATELESITDSVVVQPPSAAALKPLREAKAALEGRRVHMRIAEDGEMTVARRSGGGIGLGADMPSVLPRNAVRVGESWTRELRVPLSTTHDAAALVHTTFRLDSLDATGGVAYVSLRGNVSHDHAEDHSGMTGRTTGTLTGTLQVDRRLAWIIDSRMTIALTSTEAPAGHPPRHMSAHITQVIRALPQS